MRKLIKLLEVVRFLFALRNLPAAVFFARRAFPFERVNALFIKKGMIGIRSTGELYSLAQWSLCKERPELFLQIAEHPEMQLQSVASNKLLLHWKGIRLHLQSFDNFYVAWELFQEGVYRFNSKKDFVVADIGMNVGTAALYFSTYDNVKKIIGYEPFPDTFQRAEANLQLNTLLHQKIQTACFGVGAKAETLQIPLTDTDTAARTLTDNESLPASATTSFITIEVAPVAPILKQLETDHPQESILIKMDCEGAEYDLLAEMDRQQLFTKVEMLFIEWHRHGSDSLVAILDKNGYSSMVFPRPNYLMPDTGMIYAFRDHSSN